jgi:hypothetical protein
MYGSALASVAAVAPNFCTAADLSTLGQFAAASDDQKVNSR